MSQPIRGEQLLVFDCDGVLVDSEVLVIEIESQLLTEAGFAITADEIADTCVGLSYADMMLLLEERFDRPVPVDLNSRIQTAALAAFPDRLQPVQGIGVLLASNQMTRCVASSSNLDRIMMSLEITGLRDLFEANSIFSAQMVDRGKPAPDLFLHAAEHMSVEPSKCTVIEDSPHGVAAALAAGMNVIGFVGGLHARPSLSARLSAAGAQQIATTSTELAAVLGEL